MEPVEPVAILYQSGPPPEKEGIKKPMKPGGYSDSGADIGYALSRKNIPLITPMEKPSVDNDLDWVFPDDEAGILAALSAGAKTLWLNTVLYNDHPIEKFIAKGLYVIGQIPGNVDLYDDKWTTNNLLRKNNMPVPDAALLSPENLPGFEIPFPFPVVAKPVRGRGSEGVVMLSDQLEFTDTLSEMFAADRFGTAMYVEQFLPGQEITITVMPPGNYIFNEEAREMYSYWSLPAVKRFNHRQGIAPYNGVVAVVNNSLVLSDEELRSEAIQKIYDQCEKAALIVGGKAPIRIDWRANADGEYFLFDLNMKPNLTVASRPHRSDQDSLTALAARKIGWDYTDLLINILLQKWRLPDGFRE